MSHNQFQVRLKTFELSVWNLYIYITYANKNPYNWLFVRITFYKLKSSRRNKSRIYPIVKNHKMKNKLKNLLYSSNHGFMIQRI